jgi:hypothetical protein
MAEAQRNHCRAARSTRPTIGFSALSDPTPHVVDLDMDLTAM